MNKSGAFYLCKKYITDAFIYVTNAVAFSNSGWPTLRGESALISNDAVGWNAEVIVRGFMHYEP
ncbi:hypothetical protein GCM10009794_19260 [Rothia terrae]